MKYFLTSVILLIIVMFGIKFLHPIHYNKQAKSSISFYLDEDFDTVRKIFTFTKAHEDLIKLQQGELIDKKLSGLRFKLKPLEVKILAKLKIKTKYGILQFDHKVVMNKDQIQADTILSDYCKVNHNLVLTREGNKTKADVLLSIGLDRTLLACFENYADNQIMIGLSESQARLQQGLKQVVKEKSPEVKNKNFLEMIRLKFNGDGPLAE